MDSGKQKTMNQYNICDIREIEKQIKLIDLHSQNIDIEISKVKETRAINDSSKSELLKELLKTKDHINKSIYHRIKMIENIKSQLLIC